MKKETIMSGKKTGRGALGRMAAALPDIPALVAAYRKKNISPLQARTLWANSAVLKQNMANFTEIYGSRRMAWKKMYEIIGGNIRGGRK